VLFFLIFLKGGFFALTRIFYDFLVFYLIIKPRSRLPVKNTFLARRIQGPGLVSDFYFQIDPELALVSLQVLIEEKELVEAESEITRKIHSAAKHSRKHIQSLLDPLSLMLRADNTALRELDSSTRELLLKLKKKIENHRRQFPLNVRAIPTSHRVALPAKQLDATLKKGAEIVEKFYPSRIFSRMTEDGIITFWHNLELLENDWLGLTRKLISEIFTSNFLRPLEVADSVFSIKVEHASFKSYTSELIDDGAITDDLEDVVDNSPLYEEGKFSPTFPFISLYDTTRPSGNMESIISAWKYCNDIMHSRLSALKKSNKTQYGSI